MAGSDGDERNRREFTEGDRYDSRREDLLLHQRVGELTGRVHAVESKQQNLDNHLTRIEDQLHQLSKRMAWFAGAVAVIVPLTSFGGWYMAYTGAGPFPDVNDPGNSSVIAPLDPNESVATDNEDKKNPPRGDGG